MAERITQMTRQRFLQLRQEWVDGTLAKRWEGKTATTKAEKVEERQIRAITALYKTDITKDMDKVLNSNDWDEIIFLKDGNMITIQVTRKLTNRTRMFQRMMKSV